MNRDKLLELAITRLERQDSTYEQRIEASDGLRALLSQQEQEPVAKVVHGTEFGTSIAFIANGKDLPKPGTLLYLAPLIQNWQEIPPAQGWNEATASDETILSHMSKYWEHQWHDGDQHQIRISREQLIAGIRAIARPSQAQEQSDMGFPISASGAADDTMTIDYELGGKFWHRDCKKARDGIMRPVSHEENSSTIECMHCGMRGSYPVGAVGSCLCSRHPCARPQEDGK
jgi:hypothetical protein